jgi:DNA-binding MarR family transcriptional regulator
MRGDGGRTVRKQDTKGDSKVDAPHAYGGLDRLLHEKARLGILVALLNRGEGVLFPELKGLCELTDGNLARHLAALHEAEIVELWKNQEGPRSRTLVRLSTEGRKQFLQYLSELERVLQDAKVSPARTRRDAPGPGWSPA